MKRILVIFGVIVVIALAFFLTAKISNKRGYSNGYSDAFNSIKKDTLVIHDTTRIEKPVEVVKWKDKLVYVPVTDTIVKNDTTYIALQFEKKEYRDSTYTAQVSGYKPNLDWIEVYQKTQIVTQTIEVPKKGWSFGIGFGPGVLYNDTGFHGGIAITFGGTFSF